MKEKSVECETKFALISFFFYGTNGEVAEASSEN